MRRSMLIAVALAAVLMSLVGVGTVAGGRVKPTPMPTLPPVAPLTVFQGIKTVDNIDASFVEYAADGTALDALTLWMETGSASRACLATMTEEQAPTPMVTDLYCHMRTKNVDGTGPFGMWVEIGLAGPMLAGSFSVNVYQEGAKGYGPPMPWGPYQH